MIANETCGSEAACRVLLVENDDGVRDALAELLANGGCAVEVAAHGEEALRRLKELDAPELPDVILLDLMMPVMNGWRFTVEMREDPRLANIPVVVLSAVRPPLAKAARAEAYLQKPLDVSKMMETVQRIAATHRSYASAMTH